MDEQVRLQVTEGFAMDLWETVRAAKGITGEKVFRHTMFEDGELIVFVGFFPKRDLLEFPEMAEEFRVQLKTFNLLGVVTDKNSSMDMFLLGGANKPFTSFTSVAALQKSFNPESVIDFLHMYFQARGFSFDIRTISHEDFMQAVAEEALSETPMAGMAKLQKLFEL